MSINKSAGQIFKEARVKKGLTQIELAKESGVYWNTIAKIERGIQVPKSETSEKLAKVLGLKSSDIYSF